MRQHEDKRRFAKMLIAKRRTPQGSRYVRAQGEDTSVIGGVDYFGRAYTRTVSYLIGSVENIARGR
jgi:hypothetical protein